MIWLYDAKGALAAKLHAAVGCYPGTEVRALNNLVQLSYERLIELNAGIHELVEYGRQRWKPTVDTSARLADARRSMNDVLERLKRLPRRSV